MYSVWSARDNKKGVQRGKLSDKGAASLARVDWASLGSLIREESGNENLWRHSIQRFIAAEIRGLWRRTASRRIALAYLRPARPAGLCSDSAGRKKTGYVGTCVHFPLFLLIGNAFSQNSGVLVSLFLLIENVLSQNSGVLVPLFLFIENALLQNSGVLAPLFLLIDIRSRKTAACSLLFSSLLKMCCRKTERSLLFFSLSMYVFAKRRHARFPPPCLLYWFTRLPESGPGHLSYLLVSA